MPAYIYIHTYIHTHTYTYIHRHTYTHYMHIHTYIHTLHAHTYIHTYIETHTYSTCMHAYIHKIVGNKCMSTSQSLFKLVFPYIYLNIKTFQFCKFYLLAFIRIFFYLLLHTTRFIVP